MKICIISYDFFGYDKHIAEELKRRGNVTTHIDISKYHFVYKNKSERIKNFFYKFFLGRNIKQESLKKYILNQLSRIGHQDKILVIRPDLISRNTHLLLKKQSSEYICYLYDSTKRFKVKHLLQGVFDRIYSYDPEDAKDYNLIPITNYIYSKKMEIKTHFEYNIFIVISADERLSALNSILEKLDALNLKTKCIVVNDEKPAGLHPNIEYSAKKISIDDIQNLMSDSEIILDLIRKDHNGLSFRIFEALALQRKIITTNQYVKNYDFYDPNNIMVLDINNIEINKSFFSTPYVPLEETIYNKYTISNWVSTVFEL